MAVSASAPAKAVLCGEYAVLDGAPAISLALNKRATVELRDNDLSMCRVFAPGYFEHACHCRLLDDGTLRWETTAGQPEVRFELLQQVWAVCAEYCSDLPCVDITLDTRCFYDDKTGAKLGLGSSAALTVALTGALQALAGSSTLPARTAALAHLNLQGGRGSGVDIATAMRGGVIGFQASSGSTNTWQLDSPAGLISDFYWSGSAAGTIDALQRFEQHGAASNPRFAALKQSAMDVLAVWPLTERPNDDITILLAAFENYVAVLEQFDRDAKLGIFANGHAQLRALAAELGAVYKPCGAGGGDIGVFLTDNNSLAAQFREQAAGCGASRLDVRQDHDGLRVIET